MSEKIREVRMFEGAYMCDGKSDAKCDGTMMPTGEILQVAPPMFKHRCLKCGDIKYLNRNFPLTVGIPINDPIPEVWLDKLDRTQINNPPPEKSKIIQ